MLELRRISLAILALAPALTARPALAAQPTLPAAGLQLAVPVTITNTPLPVSGGVTVTNTPSNPVPVSVSGNVSLGGTASVNVANTPSVNVANGVLSVRSVDNPALQPYTISQSVGPCSSTGSVNVVQAQVPAGKTMVIESIDLMLNTLVNFFPSIYLTTSYGGNNSFHVIPASQQGNNNIAVIYQANHLVKYYASQGSTIMLYVALNSANPAVNANGTQMCIDQYSINGYLVNTP